MLFTQSVSRGFSMPRGLQIRMMRHHEVPFVVRSWLAAAYVCCLTYLLVAPEPLQMLGQSGDAFERAFERSVSGFFQHAIAYGLLAALLLYAFAMTRRWSTVTCLTGASLHGLVMEGVQLVIPDRYCDWVDMLANLLGVTVGWAAFTIISAKPGKCEIARDS